MKGLPNLHNQDDRSSPQQHTLCISVSYPLHGHKLCIAIYVQKLQLKCYSYSYRAGACDVTSVALNRNVWQKRVAFVWKQAMNWSCSAIGCTNKDTKETKDKKVSSFM